MQAANIREFERLEAARKTIISMIDECECLPLGVQRSITEILLCLITSEFAVISFPDTTSNVAIMSVPCDRIAKFRERYEVLMSTMNRIVVMIPEFLTQ